MTLTEFLESNYNDYVYLMKPDNSAVIDIAVFVDYPKRNELYGNVDNSGIIRLHEVDIIVVITLQKFCQCHFSYP